MKHPSQPRRFSRPAPHPPATSTVFAPFPPTAPRRKSFRPMPSSHHPPGLGKRLSLSRQSLVFLLLAASVAFLFVLTAQTGDTLAPDGLARYTHAAAHFRKQLDPAALAQYYRERSEIIDKDHPLNRPDEREYVIVDVVSDPFFQKCMVDADHAVLHQSLRRGPDQKEIDGRKSAKQPRDFEDTFATIDRKRYLFHPDRPAVQTVDALGAGLDKQLGDAVTVATAVVEKDAGGVLKDVEIPISYIRTTRRDGTQIIVNIGGSINNTETGQVSRTRRVVTVSSGYGRPCEVSFTRPREMVKIHVLLAYSNRPHRLAAFLNMFADYFKAAKTDLVKVVVSTTKEEKNFVAKAAKEREELTPARFAIITSSGDELGNFSRAVAMREAANTVPEDEVIFMSDADLSIGGNFLQNCRVNIVKGYQVWFPIMFSLYPYGKSLSSKDGLWRRSSYGMACMYKGDFSKVGGFGGNEETDFTGWGSEDVFIYNQFRDNEKYAVLRTLEPGLQHNWHGKDCERNEHYENCMRTVYMTIGSQDAIAKLMSEKNVDVSSLTKDAKPV